MFLTDRILVELFAGSCARLKTGIERRESSLWLSEESDEDSFNRVGRADEVGRSPTLQPPMCRLANLLLRNFDRQYPVGAGVSDGGYP
ncbi:MAG: hypothetical protein ACI9BW_001247 [Gammaproteobacteria bacterium]|jgi:hypothetical protein